MLCAETIFATESYLYRTIDKYGHPVDFLLIAKWLFARMLKDQPLFAPSRLGTDGAGTFPSAIKAASQELLLPQDLPITSRNICNKGLKAIILGSKNRPKGGGFQSFNTAHKTIKGFRFSDDLNVLKQNELFALCFELQRFNKA